ncbi:MAG: putative zinc-binding peptidase [Chitinophagaceae bacterium]|nr:putative zinc-binding peptidase [Chitinophagaceae bacterium]
MKLFICTHCSQPLYFENYYCGNCGADVGFDPAVLEFIPVAENTDGRVVPVNAGDPRRYRYCSNRAYNVCNWLVPDESGNSFCKACNLNRTIPDLDKNDYHDRWKALELAKHRLVYSLLQLGLPVVSKIQDEATGLIFDFKADDKKKVLTGHALGVITINISEANDIEREMARRNLDEVYRTVLGHFRHEVGHYYWDRLILNTPLLEDFRQLFGDETKNYGKALKTHYKNGAPLNWNRQFISAYASAHPWEDWAETWAHYLHMIDTLETAYAFGIGIRPKTAANTTDLDIAVTADPYHTKDFATIIKLWMPLTIVMNSLNRSMGLPDAYPFVISASVLEKLQFIHEVCYGQRKG